MSDNRGRESKDFHTFECLCGFRTKGLDIHRPRGIVLRLDSLKKILSTEVRIGPTKDSSLCVGVVLDTLVGIGREPVLKRYY